MFRFAQHDPGDAEGLLRQSIPRDRKNGRAGARPYRDAFSRETGQEICVLFPLHFDAIARSAGLNNLSHKL